MLYDLNAICDPQDVACDIVIVGGGAAGLTLARELRNTPLRIVILEGGGSESEEDVQALNDLVNVGAKIRETPTRVRALGGTLSMWGGGLKIMDDIDFEKKSWAPYRGWPIGPDEFAPYWDVLESRYGFPPLALHSYKYWAPKLSAVERDICETGDYNVGTFHHIDDLGDFRRRLIDDVLDAENIDIYLHANVEKLHLSGNLAQIANLTATTLDGRRMNCRADYVVLACGGIENAALLLRSSDEMTTGIGNERDLVGRFYMDHPRAEYGRVVPYNKRIRLPYFWGKRVSTGMVRLTLSPSRELMERERILNHRVEFIPVYEYESHTSYRSAESVRELLGESKPASQVSRFVKDGLRRVPFFGDVKAILVDTQLEQSPDPDSRVLLCNRCDGNGKRRVSLDWRIGDEEKNSYRRFHRHLLRTLENIGDVDMDLDGNGEWPISNDASHHMGTTRMADSPERGVVDPDCKVFGVENLYVVGSSVFPTGGNTNPTLTIMAMSLRLADHLKAALASAR